MTTIYWSYKNSTFAALNKASITLSMIELGTTNYTAPPLRWRAEPVWSDYINLIDSTAISHKAPDQTSLWGNQSVVHSSEKPAVDSDAAAPRTMLTVKHSWPGIIIAIIIVCLYNFILYRYRRNISAAIKATGNIEDSLTLMREQMGGISNFLASGVLLFALSIVLLLIVLYSYTGAQFAHPLLTVIALSIAAVAAVWLYIYIAMWIIRWMGDAREVAKQIRFLSNTDATLASIVLAPAILVIALSEKFLALGIVICILLYLYHLFILYKYFAVSQFSKLQLILYLCVVEILPASYILALMVKESGIN